MQDFEGLEAVADPRETGDSYPVAPRRFRRYWAWKSRRRRQGRPPITPEMRILIQEMSEALLFPRSLWILGSELLTHP